MPAHYGFGTQRMLIASLFLPNTVSFEVPETHHADDYFSHQPYHDHIRQPHMEIGLSVPPSPAPNLIAGLQQDVSKRPSSPGPQILGEQLFPQNTSVTPGTPAALTQPKSRAFLERQARTHLAKLGSTAVILPEIPPQNSSRLASNGDDTMRRRSDITGRKRLSIDSSEFFAQASWSVVPSPHGNGGLFNAVYAVSHKVKEKLWIGTIGMPTDALSEGTKNAISEKFINEHESLPVMVADSEFDGAYSQFCKQILWPTFHYVVPDQPKSKVFHDDSWKQYVDLNQKFADTIADAYRPGDIIWINDYHLLLVPGMLRSRLPQALIGFFLHIPFPSSEIYRCLPIRNQLLEGVLGADMIGFQTYSFARHFLQTASRLLSLEATPKGIHLENSFVSVGIFPIGIDIKSLNDKLGLSEVNDWLSMLQDKYEGKKLIVGRDKLDYIKGVRQKFLAFELFLERYPEWQGQVVLIQVALSTTEQNELQGQVSDVVSRINSKYSNLAYQPIVFLHQDITFPQYLALLSAADACLITSLRDGMNLTSHEYVVCQEKKKSPLILSEFTGTYGSFGACIRINPWDYAECAEAIHEALVMDEEEKDARWKELYAHVHTCTAQYWTESYIVELQKVQADQRRRHSLHIARLSNKHIEDMFTSSHRRLFLLDYDGTLANFSKTPTMYSSPQRILNILSNLTSNPRNIVFVVSGRSRANLDDIFSRVPGLGLCAENGCFMRSPNGKWESTVEDMDLSWRAPVRDIFHFYTERTPGSTIEEKEIGLVFHFSNAEHPSYGAWQAAECCNHLSDALGNYHIHTLTGNKNIEVMPKNISKGAVASRILREEGSEHPFDFVLAIGDDRSDEDMFDTVNKMSNQIQHIITATVGAKSSEADFFLPGTMSVLSALENLVGK